MTRFKNAQFLVLYALLLILATAVSAEVPDVLNYQGMLTDASGDPVADGSYEITFSTWNDLVGGLSGPVWVGAPVTVHTVNGVFTCLVGPIPLSEFTGASDRYLSMRIGSGSELEPRTRLVSVPFAYHAFGADTAGVAREVVDNSIATEQLAPNAVHETDLAPNAVNSIKIADATIQFVDIGANGASEGQVMKMIGSAWVPADDETGASGTVHRDFLVWNATVSNPVNIHIKTNIHMNHNMHYRFLVEGYNYDAAQAINSEAVGYASSFANNITRFKNNNYDAGVSISQYKSSDGYVVIKLKALLSTYSIGFGVSAWFVNPSGPFDIEAVVYHQDANL